MRKMVNSEYSNRYLQLAGQVKKSCRKNCQGTDFKVNSILKLLIDISLASHAFKVNWDTASYNGWERGGRPIHNAERTDIWSKKLAAVSPFVKMASLCFSMSPGWTLILLGVTVHATQCVALGLHFTLNFTM